MEKVFQEAIDELENGNLTPDDFRDFVDYAAYKIRRLRNLKVKPMKKRLLLEKIDRLCCLDPQVFDTKIAGFAIFGVAK